MGEAWKRLFKSRKFLLLLLDAVVSTLTLVLTKFLSPADLDFALKLIAIYQPAFIFLIGSIAYENGKIVPAQYSLEESKEYNAIYAKDKLENK